MNRTTFLALTLCSLLASPTSAAPKKKTEPAAEGVMDPKSLSPNDLNLRIIALQTIHDLDLNADQIHFLGLVAGHSAATPANHAGGVAGEKLRAAMLELHGALVANDEDRVAEARSAVDEARDEDDNVDLDDNVLLTVNATPHVDEVLKLLRSSQIAAYIGARADSIGDPVELLVDGLDKARGDADEDWAADREDILRDVATLAVGFRDDKGAKKMKDRVRDYLNKARKMPAAEFEANRAQIEKDAQKVVGENHPFTCIQHWMETEIAQLLSNAQLPAALIERGVAAAAAEKGAVSKAKAEK